MTYPRHILLVKCYTFSETRVFHTHPSTYPPTMNADYQPTMYSKYTLHTTKQWRIEEFRTYLHVAEANRRLYS